MTVTPIELFAVESWKRDLLHLQRLNLTLAYVLESCTTASLASCSRCPTRVLPGRDYKGQSVSAIGWEKRHNARLAHRSRDEFTVLMAALNLPRPKLIASAVPANQNLALPHGAG